MPNVPRVGNACFGAVICLLITLMAMPTFGSEIKRSENLQKSAQLARQKGLPIILFVSRDACPYCERLRESVLLPMLGSEQFDNSAMLVELNIDGTNPVTGFDGRSSTAADIAASYKAQITPTLLFLGFEGQEITGRRIGVPNLEYYRFYLDKSIQDAGVKLSGR